MIGTQRRKVTKQGCWRNGALVLAAWSLAAGTATAGPAPAPSPTEKALQRAEEALRNEQGLNPETRDALRELLATLRAERAAQGKPPAPGTGAPPGTGTKRPNRLTVNGDFRLRHESSFLSDAEDRHRERVRFRLGANYQLTDEVLVGARVATGPRTDAQSPHQTLGEVFHKFEWNLDRAFASYRPKQVPGLNLTAGKFGHPFYLNPVYGELVWDADVQPEGILLGHTFRGRGALDRIDLNLGEYLLLEQGGGDESAAFVAQVAAHGKLGKYLRPSAALSYYRYGDLTPDGALAILNENSGNEIVGAGPTADFASRFELLNPILALGYHRWKYPLILSGEFIHNLRAASNRDTGWAVGLAYGAAQKQGDWRVYYQHQVVEQDAVLSLVAQDDFLFSTNHRSHIFGANYQLRDNIGLHLWGLLSRLETAPNPEDDFRLRLDANFRF